MIVVESITIQNFLSIGAIPQTVVLCNAPLTLVLGINVDAGGETSRNGVGKTALAQAICYALYGEPLTSIKKDNLVNSTNGQAMLASIIFRRDGVLHRIERGRKPNVLRYYVGTDGEDLAQGTTAVTQALIERAIGMSHTMFLHVVTLNTYTTPFLKLRAAEQREVIEELMGITQISQLADQLKLGIDKNKESLRDEEARAQATVEANARITQVIEDARHAATAWQEAHDRTLAQLIARSAGLTEVDIDSELRRFDEIDAWTERHRQGQEQIKLIGARLVAPVATLRRLRDDLARHTAAASGEASPQVLRLQQQLDRCRADAERSITPQLDRMRVEAAAHRNKAVMLGREVAELAAAQLAVAVDLNRPDCHVCRTCGQGLTGSAHLAEVMAALRTQAERLDERLACVHAAIAQCEANAEACEQELTDLEARHVGQQQALCRQAAEIEQDIARIEVELCRQCDEAIRQRDAVQAEITALQADIGSQERQLAKLESTLAEIGGCPLSIWGSRDALWRLRQERAALDAQIATETAKINPAVAQIEGLTGTLLTLDYSRLDELTDQLKHEQFLYKLLTSKDSFIRKRIIDQNLGYLNHCLLNYLQRLGLPHSVRFQPDLSVEITLGQDFDFDQLSRGEMSRVILATSFAFRELWENLNHPVNLLFADEIVDQGIDQAGVEAAVLLLQQLASRKNIFLISHRGELQERIDHVLTVRKEANFTSFAVA